MATDNPSNPFTQDPKHTQKDVAMSVSKARVVDAKGHPGGFGFHVVRIRVYGDGSTYLAPVLTPMAGSVWVPKEGTDVAVIFTDSDKPFVIGSWYAVDRIEDGDVDLPQYTAGDIRLGNESGSHVTVRDDGRIRVRTDDDQPVDIDHQAAVVSMSADQSIAGDDQYYEINFDTAENDPESLHDAADNAFVVRNDGQHKIGATVEFQTPGQNNRYTIALFKNGSLIKRKNRQSVVNDELSLDVRTARGFDAGDVLDVRVRQDSGSPHTLNSAFEATEFTIFRHGI